MAGNNMVTGAVVVVLVGVLVYLVDPTFFGLLSTKQGFTAEMNQGAATNRRNFTNMTSTGEAGVGMASSGPLYRTLRTWPARRALLALAPPKLPLDATLVIN